MMILDLLTMYILMVVVFSLFIRKVEEVLKQKAPEGTKAVVLMWPLFVVVGLFYLIFVQSYLNIVEAYKWYRSSSDE